MESGLDDFQHLDMTWYDHFGVPCETLQGANTYKARYQIYGHILILALHVPLSPTFSASDWWISFRMTRTCLAALVTQIRQRLVPKKYVHPRLHHALDPGKLKIWDCRKKLQHVTFAFSDWPSMSWFSQCILGGSKQVPQCSPWSPCHGCMNFQNSHRFDWHLLQNPQLSDSWGSWNEPPDIGVPPDLQNYWNINSWGPILFEHFAIFPAEKKPLHQPKKTRWHQVILSRVVRVVPTSTYGDVVVPNSMVVSSGLKNLLHWDPGWSRNPGCEVKSQELQLWPFTSYI